MISPWFQLATLILTALLALIGFRKALERDRAANWQKAKLELYSEFVNSFAKFLANISQSNAGHRNYHAETLNKMSLFAPPEILLLCYSIQDKLERQNKCQQDIEKLLDLLREDILPNVSKSRNDRKFALRLVVPGAPTDNLQ